MTDIKEIKRTIYLGFLIMALSMFGVAYYTITSIGSFESAIETNFDNIQRVINYNLTSMKDNLNSQVGDINKSVIFFQSHITNTLADVESGLRKELKNESINLKSNLSSQISMVEQVIDISKKESQEKIKELSSALEKVESTYAEKFNNLKAELYLFNISSLDVTTPDFSDTIINAMPSVVSVISGKGQASGVFVSNNEIITNYHVVSESSTITILTSKGESFIVNLKSYNDSIDLALLEAPSTGSFKGLKLASLSNVKLGSKVIAIGNPYGFGFSVTEGIVSGLNRVGPSGLPIYVQTDVPVNPGNSGGPIININGDIVGITTFKVSNSEGLGFAIGSDYIQHFLSS